MLESGKAELLPNGDWRVVKKAIIKFCSKYGNAVSCATPEQVTTVCLCENFSLWGYFLRCFAKYAVFSGRARRKEYWGFFLFSQLIGLGLYIPVAIMSFAMGDEELAFADVISSIYSLGLLLPSLAVSARRLHDIGRSGWYMLWWVLPTICIIIWSIAIVSTNAADTSPFAIVTFFGWLMGCIAGFILWIISMCKAGDSGENQYGQPYTQTLT